MIPRPETTCKITESFIEEIINWGVNLKRCKDYKPGKFWYRGINVSELVLVPMFISADVNRDRILEYLKITLKSKINSKDDDESQISVELCRNLIYFSHGLSHKNSEMDLNFYKMVDMVQDEVFYECNDRIQELCPKFFGIALIEFLENKIDIEELLGMHGLEKLCYDYYFLMPPNIGYNSYIFNIVNILYGEAYDPQREESYKKIRKNACSLAKYMIQNPTPWVLNKISPQQIDIITINFYTPDTGKKYIALGNNELFCIYILFCMFYESIKDSTYYEEFDKQLHKWPCRNPLRKY